MADMQMHFARIKFLEDDDVRIIEIKNIIEFRENIPEHRNDFDKKKIYTVLWTDSKNPNEIKLGAQISELFATYDEAQTAMQNKRGQFSKLNNSDIANYYNNSKSDNEDELVKKKKKARILKECVKKAKENNVQVIKKQYKNNVILNNRPSLRLDSITDSITEKNCSQLTMSQNSQLAARPTVILQREPLKVIQQCDNNSKDNMQQLRLLSTSPILSSSKKRNNNFKVRSLNSNTNSQERQLSFSNKRKENENQSFTSDKDCELTTESALENSSFHLNLSEDCAENSLVESSRVESMDRNVVNDDLSLENSGIQCRPSNHLKNLSFLQSPNRNKNSEHGFVSKHVNKRGTSLWNPSSTSSPRNMHENGHFSQSKNYEEDHRVDAENDLIFQNSRLASKSLHEHGIPVINRSYALSPRNDHENRHSPQRLNHEVCNRIGAENSHNLRSTSRSLNKPGLPVNTISASNSQNKHANNNSSRSSRHELDNRSVFENDRLRNLRSASRCRNNILNESISSSSEHHLSRDESENLLQPRANNIHLDSETESDSDDEAADEYYPCLYKYNRRLYDRFSKYGLMSRNDDLIPLHERYYVMNNKVYLGLNCWADEDCWNLTKKKELGIFLREVAMYIFKKKLLYSCIDDSKVSNKLDKEIKLINHNKTELFLSLIEDQLNNDIRYKEKYCKNTKKQILKNAVRRLGTFIRDLKAKKIDELAKTANK